MVSHCCFDLHFLIIYDEQHLFLCLFAICIFFSVRYLSLKVFAPFFNQVVLLLWNFKRSLYMLDSSCLSDVSFCKYFLPVCGFSYSLILSFTEQTF